MKKLLILITILTLTGCSRGDKEAAEKFRIIETVNHLFIETDNRDWKAVSDLFTGEVLFDMSSMTGAKPAKISSKEIITAWENGLREIKYLHHQAGNYIVEYKGNEAKVFCYGIASHYKQVPSGSNVRTFVGSYNFHLIKQGDAWKIDAFRFNLKYIDGNKNL